MITGIQFIVLDTVGFEYLLASVSELYEYESYEDFIIEKYYSMGNDDSSSDYYSDSSDIDRESDSEVDITTNTNQSSIKIEDSDYD